MGQVQFWSGKKWFPYENLVAWYECDETTRFIIQDGNTFVSHSINERLNTETKLSFAQILDNSPSNNRDIPRIGINHLHLKSGSFPLDSFHIVYLSNDEIKLVFEFKMLIPNLTIKEVINDDIKEKLNTRFPHLQ